MKAKYLIEILKQYPEHEVNIIYGTASIGYDKYNINGLVSVNDEEFLFGVEYLGGDEEL